MSKRCVHSAAIERHAADREAHLDAAERTGQHEVVEVAEVSDAEDAALDLAEAHPERHVEALENGLANAIGIVRLWDDDRGHHVAELAGVRGEDLEIPGFHGAP